MKKSLLILAGLTLFSTFSLVSAQERRMGPPPALLIVREEIKPGMMGSHGRHSADYVGIFSQLQTPNHRIALVPVAGNENEVVYINPLESFAELERTNKNTDEKMGAVSGSMRAKMDGLEKEAPAMHAAMRDMLAIFRPELSFNPGANIAQMRYFSVTTTRVRPGFDAAYAEYIQKILNIARQKVKADDLHIAMFQVISGAPGGTYMSFRPMKSLSEMDAAIPMKVRAAMSDDQRRDADKAVRESVITSETSLYAFAPSMSYVPKEFAAADPAFWNPKPQMAVKPKPKKRAPKPAAPPAN